MLICVRDLAKSEVDSLHSYPRKQGFRVREILGGTGPDGGYRCPLALLLAAGMFTTTGKFNDSAFISVFTILAAVLRICSRGTFTQRMRALAILIGHKVCPLSRMISSHPRPGPTDGQADTSRQSRLFANHDSSFPVAETQFDRLVQLNWMLFAINADEQS